MAIVSRVESSRSSIVEAAPRKLVVREVDGNDPIKGGLMFAGFALVY